MGKIHWSKGNKSGRVAVIATPDEIGLVPEGCRPVIITGVGAINVWSSLENIPRDTPLLNVGYAGSGTLKKGLKVPVTKCKLHHPNVSYLEQDFELEFPVVPGLEIRDYYGVGATCLTMTDFGGDPKIQNAVFDMELAFILAMGFSDVICVKTVSDACDYGEYESTIANK